MLEKFKEERKLEKETSAIVNYFKLILEFYLTLDINPNYEANLKTFSILSIDYLKELVIDLKENNFVIKDWQDLLIKLKDNLVILNKDSMTKSVIVEETINSGKVMINYLENNFNPYRTTIFMEYLKSFNFNESIDNLSSILEKLTHISLEYTHILESTESSKKLVKNI